MQITAKLYVNEGRVVCPRHGDWKDVSECAHCVAARAVHPPDQPRLVICTPDIDAFENSLDRMIRAPRV